MTDYTPDIGTIREWYVTGIRNAFIASAGEHEQEFDRAIAAHDAEVAANALRHAANDLPGGHSLTPWGLRLRATRIQQEAASTVEPSLPRNKDTDMTDHGYPDLEAGELESIENEDRAKGMASSGEGDR